MQQPEQQMGLSMQGLQMPVSQMGMPTLAGPPSAMAPPAASPFVFHVEAPVENATPESDAVQVTREVEDVKKPAKKVKKYFFLCC